MKIKILFFVLGAGLILAGCTSTDKDAEAKMMQLEKDMISKDSMCMADKQMLLDSIMSLREEMMTMGKASTSTTTTTTKVTPPTTTKKTDVTEKEGATKKIDIKKKGGATGGN